MSGVKNGLNKTSANPQSGSTTQPTTTQTQPTGGSLFSKGDNKPVIDQDFLSKHIDSQPTTQPASTAQPQQTQTGQQGGGGGFWNKVGNFAGSVMDKTGTGAKKTGSFMKKAAPWIAGLTAAGALAAGIGAGRFIFKDHSRRY